MKNFQKCVETLVYSLFSFQKYVETVVFSNFSKLLAVETVVYSLPRKLFTVATHSAGNRRRATNLFIVMLVNTHVDLSQNLTTNLPKNRIRYIIRVRFYDILAGNVVLRHRFRPNKPFLSIRNSVPPRLVRNSSNRRCPANRILRNAAWLRRHNRTLHCCYRAVP